MGDTGNHPLHQTHIDGILKRPEPQGVEQRNRPCAHGEDVPKDSSNACGSALKRLHSRRMIVTFNLERQTVTVTKIHHTGVFPRSNQNAGSLSGKAPEQRSGVAITAMLRPHHAEHAELDPIRRTSQSSTDLVPIPWLQTFLPESCHVVVSRGIRKGDQG